MSRGSNTRGGKSFRARIGKGPKVPIPQTRDEWLEGVEEVKKEEWLSESQIQQQTENSLLWDSIDNTIPEVSKEEVSQQTNKFSNKGNPNGINLGQVAKIKTSLFLRILNEAIYDGYCIRTGIKKFQSLEGTMQFNEEIYIKNIILELTNKKVSKDLIKKYLVKKLMRRNISIIQEISESIESVPQFVRGEEILQIHEYFSKVLDRFEEILSS